MTSVATLHKNFPYANFVALDYYKVDYYKVFWYNSEGESEDKTYVINNVILDELIEATERTQNTKEQVLIRQTLNF